MPTTSTDHVSPSVPRFLEDLAANNDKAWFDANRKRYELDLVEPVRAFVRAMGERIESLSPHLVADDRKSGGSMTRIHRDVRFSKDKSPYHTHVGLHFWHRDGKKGQCPGLFLRIAPDGVLMGTGLHGPEPDQTEAVRRRIADRTDEWRKATGSADFRKHWGELAGEGLKRPPKGFDPDHPAIDELKRKDYVGFAELPVKEATKKGFADRAVARWAASKPLFGFLCEALDLRF